jgi:outer membrane protein assembly factor BamB
VVALNRFNGELIWNCKGLSERSAYTQSNLITIPNRQIFITFTAYSMIGIDAETGEHLWTHKQNNTPLEKRRIGIGDTHSNAPIYEDGSIYYCEGDGNCGVKLSLSDDGSEISEIWKNQTFDGFMGGIVKIGNFIYGSGTARKELFSINATTGQLTDSLKIGSGALIAADKMLYYYNQRGILSLIKYDHGKLIKISSFRIKKGTNQHFSHPVINKGVLYQRHGNILMAFDIKEK